MATDWNVQTVYERRQCNGEAELEKQHPWGKNVQDKIRFLLQIFKKFTNILKKVIKCDKNKIYSYLFIHGLIDHV